MPPVSAVLFDWDGTLADSFATTRRASLTVFRHFGLDLDDARYRATYRPDWHETYRQLGIPEARWDEAGVIWTAAYRERAAAVTLYPGVAEMLARLSAAGIRLGVVTSADRRRFLADLERLDLGGAFEVLIAFEDVRRKKPHPEAARVALERLQLPAARALVVGDRPEDVEMGKRAGTRTAAVPSAYGDEAMLREAAPDVLLSTIAGLPRALGVGCIG